MQIGTGPIAAAASAAAAKYIYHEDSAWCLPTPPKRLGFFTLLSSGAPSLIGYGHHCLLTEWVSERVDDSGSRTIVVCQNTSATTFAGRHSTSSLPRPKRNRN